jgi:hypothetical protein
MVVSGASVAFIRRGNKLLDIYLPMKTLGASCSRLPYSGVSMKTLCQNFERVRSWNERVFTDLIDEEEILS